MAIKLVDEYVNATVADASYPGGSFKNATTGEGIDGTPLEKKWANDWLGFFQKLLAESETIPSGAPDTAVSSQYYDALMELVGELVTAHNAIAAADAVNAHIRTATQAEVTAGSAVVAAVRPDRMRFGFSISFAENGYIAFPTWLGGLIIQWASGLSTTIGDQLQTIPFPIAFPNACLKLLVSTKSPGYQGDAWFQERSFTNTQCVVYLQWSGAGSIADGVTPNILAIGY